MFAIPVPVHLTILTCRYIQALSLAFLLTLDTGSAVATEACTTRFHSELSGSQPTDSTDVVVSPFTLLCAGSIQGSLKVLTGGIFSTRLQIEKDVAGTWTVVESGNEIVYSAEPGTYRYTIRQTGANGGFATWRLRYSKPS